MAYNSNAHITTGQLKTVLTRVKTEYEAADEALVLESGTTYEVATDDEVDEMLDEIFTDTTTEESSDE